MKIFYNVSFKKCRRFLKKKDKKRFSKWMSEQEKIFGISRYKMIYFQLLDRHAWFTLQPNPVPVVKVENKITFYNPDVH